MLSLNVAKEATCFRNVSLLGDEAAKADLICSAFRRMVFMSWFFVLQCAGKLMIVSSPHVRAVLKYYHLITNSRNLLSMFLYPIL